MEDIIKISNLALDSLKSNYSGFISSSSEEETIESRYALQMKKTLWCVNNEAKANQITTNVNKATYRIDNIDYLKYCYIDFELPKISVKKEFKDTIKVSWCEKVGLAIIKDAKLFISDILVQSHNSKTLNILASLDIQNSDKEIFDRLIGNDESITAKSSCKEKIHLRVPQLWFFSKKRSVALPKYLIDNDIFFQYEYQPLSKLIKIYREDDKGVYEIEYDEKYVDLPTQYVIPDFYYRFSQITQEEKSWVKEKKFQILLQEIVLHETKIEPPINKFKFKFTDNGLCQGLIWTIQDQTDAAVNNYFTYLKSNELEYNVMLTSADHGKILSKDNKYFSLLNQWYTCNGFSEDDYNIIPFTDKIFLKATMDSGINLKDLKIKFNGELQQKPKKQYIVEFYVIISKVIEIENGKIKILV